MHTPAKQSSKSTLSAPFRYTKVRKDTKVGTQPANDSSFDPKKQPETNSSKHTGGRKFNSRREKRQTVPAMNSEGTSQWIK